MNPEIFPCRVWEQSFLWQQLSTLAWQWGRWGLRLAVRDRRVIQTSDLLPEGIANSSWNGILLIRITYSDS
jgi:hypothetical protein